MTIRFDLRPVLELAEHAVAAPLHLYHPDPTAVSGQPALTLAVSDQAYLMSAGVPGLEIRYGVPRTVYAHPDSVDFAEWRSTPPHVVVDPNEFLAPPVRGRRRMPLVSTWHLPLRQPAHRPAIALMRAAASAGYTHLTIDASSLTIAVSRRHQSPQPAPSRATRGHNAATMGNRALIGAINAPTQVVLARHIELGATPQQIVAGLRHMWCTTFAGNTSAMLTALITTDWRHLHAEITSGHRRSASGEHAVADVDMTRAVPAGQQPVSFCLTDAADLAVDWIYLIDPVTATVAVHTGDGQPAATHTLAS
jgi:hypothetical protein